MKTTSRDSRCAKTKYFGHFLGYLKVLKNSRTSDSQGGGLELHIFSSPFQEHRSYPLTKIFEGSELRNYPVPFKKHRSLTAPGVPELRNYSVPFKEHRS